VARTDRQVADAAAIAERLLVVLRRRHGCPGIAYGLRHDGTTVLFGADGVADLATGAPVDVATTRFRCASITKTFTATLVLQLVERGQLRLDDAVTTWLPWTRRTLGADVTVRHLLLHAGGVIRDGSNAWDDTTMPDREALHRELGAAATFGAPSERFRYSNMAYALLGEVLEAATKTPFAALLRRRIARPLDLAQTDADLTAVSRRALATGYYAAWPDEPRRAAAHVEARAIAPAGGLVSTVGDLLAYEQAHLPGDDRLLSELSKREMQRPQWQRATEPHYGLGWMTWHVGGISVVGHSGGYPGFTTKIAFSPRDRLCAAVLTNAISPVAALGVDAIYGSIDAVGSRWEEASAPSPWHTRAELASYGGIYRDNFGTLVVGRVHNALLVVPAEDVQPFAGASLLTATGPRRFLVASGYDFGFVGEQVRFRTDRRGAVTTLVWGPHPYVRIGP
jgi:CubicO group peptidase (beta-lactamase class C family)